MKAGLTLQTRLHSLIPVFLNVAAAFRILSISASSTPRESKKSRCASGAFPSKRT